MASCSALGYVLWVGFGPIVYWSSALLCCWLLFKIAKAHSAKALGRDKCLYRASFAFFVFIIITLILFGLIYAVTCFDDDLTQLFTIIGQSTYNIQMLILGFLWFYRLCVIFRDTAFALSIWPTQIFFYGAYAFSIFFAVIYVVITGTDLNFSIIGQVIIISAFFLITVWTICLIGLFIKKLFAVSKNVETNQGSNVNDKLMQNVTKTFVLTIASMITYAFLMLITLTQAIVGRDVIFVATLAVIGSGSDLVTNFISILFGYREFEDYYLKICGSCHRKCIRCFSKKKEVALKVPSSPESQTYHDATEITAI